MRLIVTNGQSGVDAIENAGIEGLILSWEDVLHDGPVPAGHSLEDLSNVRAEFIASNGWGDFESVHARFKERDRIIRAADSFLEVVLFFEHDLYDQLQLLQVLSLFDYPERLSLVLPPTYISDCSPEELKEEYDERIVILPEQLENAHLVWDAFTRAEPHDLGAIAYSVLFLPVHIPSAMLRLIFEYPDSNTGTSLTELQILKVLNQGVDRFGALFKACQDEEVSAFIGDWSFRKCLEDLIDAPVPLMESTSTDVTAADAILSITDTGRRILSGQHNRLTDGCIDRWIGGVHIREGNCWRWNLEEKKFEMMG